MKMSRGTGRATLALVLSVIFSAHAAPGGVSSPGVWLKSDDAGDIATAWKDHSVNNNPVEVIVLDGNSPWALSAATSEHNFHPYTTGYNSKRLFQDTAASFVPDAVNPTPLSIFAVTRQTNFAPDSDAARITGLDDNAYSPFLVTNPAGEPALSIIGAEGDNAGQVQMRSEFVSYLGAASRNYYEVSAVPLAENIITHSITGGVNNDQLQLGFNGNFSPVTLDDPAVTRGQVLSIGFGTQSADTFFNGDIMEVIWYAEELAASQVRQVNTYLAVKYGVALSGDFVGSNDEVLWSTTQDGFYNNSVFGLGRDNTSGLHQRVSRSVETDSLTIASNNDFVSENKAASRSELVDQTYFLTGHNAAAIALQSNEIGGLYSSRLSREWLVQSAGFTLPVTMKFVLPSLPSNSKVYLVRKNVNSDFSDAFDTLGEVNALTGVISGVLLNDGDYFTLAFTRDSDGDGVLDTQDAFPNDPAETIDTDSDGTGNNADTDDDNDTYLDADEIAAGSDPLDSGDTPPDSDGDSISDFSDPDDDNDGVDDIDEIAIGIDPFNPDSDGDGVMDGREVGDDTSMPLDSDGDGIPDVKETTNDSDFDGLSNYLETLIGSNPISRDSDGDDYRDNEELTVLLSDEDIDDDGIDDALDASVTGAPDRNGDGVADFALRDTDGDGTPDLLDTDSDADGIDDINETLLDSDNDGISDVLDPFIALGGGDSDADGIPDFIECCVDTDLDGQPDYTEVDSDRDGLSDRQEANLIGNDQDVDGYDDFYDADINSDGVIDNGPDANGDGIRDTWVVLDTDGDGLADYRDTDSDNDGISDSDETLYATDLFIDEDNDGVPAQADPISTVEGRDSGGGDSDGDGLSDIEECPSGYPFCTDSTHDGTPNYMTADSDGDGIPDGVECPTGSVECPDSDGDGIPDIEDNDSDQAPGTSNGGSVDNSGSPVAPDSSISADSKVDHMTASTGIGAISWFWLLGAAALFIRRSSLGEKVAQQSNGTMVGMFLSIALATSVSTTVQAAPFTQDSNYGLSKERLFFTAGPEYSRFTPLTQGSEFEVQDVHDWGFGAGVGYDLLDQLAIEWDYSNKGELLATSEDEFVNTGYSYTTFTANWYPDIWYANRRYDDDWPNKINWYISGGLSRLFVSGTANTELENNVNLMLGAGVTYGFESKFQLRGSVDKVSGDVLTLGVSLIWYPFAPEGRGINRSKAAKADVPVYVPFQVAQSIAAGERNNICQFTQQDESIIFNKGSYLITKDYLSQLNTLAARFFKCQGVSIVLVGIGDGSVTRDEQPIEFRRIDAVARYLIKMGIPSNKIVLTSQSYDSVGKEGDKDRVDVFFGR